MVYADHLIGAGDARGEYIAIELRIAAAARGSEERAALARRRAELRAAYAAEWWPELPERRIGTRHGFVEAVAVFGRELGGLEKLAEREPVSALELLDVCASPPAGAPWQEGIRRLVLHTGSGEELLPLLDSALAGAVEEVVLTSGRTLPALGHRLPRCRHLCLAGMNLHEVGSPPRSPLGALARWGHLARLEVLDLSHCQVHATAVTALELPALRVLRLSGNRIGPQGAAALAQRLPALPALQRIELQGAGIGAWGAELLAGVIADEPPPERIAIDGIGIELELVRVSESEWAIWLDGVCKPIRLGRNGTVVERAPLGGLVRALWEGVPRRLRPEDLAVLIGQDGLFLAPDRDEVQYGYAGYLPWKPRNGMYDPALSRGVL